MREDPATPGRRYRGIAAGQRQEVRRQRLLDAALACFGTHGYHATSVRALCAEAGLTERYFYESFANSEDLLRAVYETLVARLRADMAAMADRPDSVDAVLGVYFGAIEGDPRIARILFFEVLGVSPAVDQLYRQAMEDFAVLLADLIGPAGSDGTRRRIVGDGLVGAVVHIAMRWTLGHFGTPRPQVVAICADLLRAMGMADRRA